MRNATRVESHAKSTLESDLVTVYLGYRGDQVIGYAVSVPCLPRH
jgi:hypothetical protein